MAAVGTSRLVRLDKVTVLESVRKSEHVVIVQEAVRRGGLASDICSIIQEEAFDYVNAPIRVLAGQNTPIPFNLNLERAYALQELGYHPCGQAGAQHAIEAQAIPSGPRRNDGGVR